MPFRMWDGTVLVSDFPLFLSTMKTRSAYSTPAAYFLTTCAFQLPFGKLYRIFSIKWTFLASLFIFEVGSVICAVASTSVTLIVGVCVLLYRE